MRLYHTVEQRAAKVKTENNIKREHIVPVAAEQCFTNLHSAAAAAAQTVKAVFRKEAASRRGPVWPFKQAACGCGPRTASSTFP